MKQKLKELSTRKTKSDQSLDAADDLFLYFGMYAFQQLHIEEMFHAEREDLTDTEQFWRDWITLLQTKRGDVAARLLQETRVYKNRRNWSKCDEKSGLQSDDAKSDCFKSSSGFGFPGTYR